MSGRLVPPLWMVAGMAMMVSTSSVVAANRWWVAAPGLATFLVGLGMLKLDWAVVPPALARLLPAAAVVLVTVGCGSPESGRLVLITTGMLLMWAGFALDRIDLLITEGLAAVIIAIPTWRSESPAHAISITVSCWLAVSVIGVTMHLLRIRLDQTTAKAAASERRRPLDAQRLAGCRARRTVDVGAADRRQRAGGRGPGRPDHRRGARPRAIVRQPGSGVGRVVMRAAVRGFGGWRSRRRGPVARTPSVPPPSRSAR